MGDFTIEHENTKLENSDRFPCPSCGGGMRFSPEKQVLICDYCSTEIDIENENGNIKEYDIDSAEEAASDNWGEEKRIIKCESCGAESVLNANNTAQFCAFCGSSHVIKNDSNAGITPESLIPFKISEDKAKEYFKNWVESRKFAPNALKNNHQMERLSGVYIPFWTYDSHVSSIYRAEKGTYYYVTEKEWVEENGERKEVTKQVRKTRWKWVNGTYSKFFDDVLINASKQVDEKVIKNLEPFNLNELVHYEPQYLSGFLAERYSIGLKEGWEKAKVIVDDNMRLDIKRKINGDEVRNLNIRNSYNDVKFKHILLPVWISAYNYKDKVYKFMVNGQTGEVQGEAPISGVKVFFTILICILVIILGIFIFKNQ